MLVATVELVESVSVANRLVSAGVVETSSVHMGGSPVVEGCIIPQLLAICILLRGQ